LALPQKKARREGRTIVWVDEAGFYLLAGVVRTYAPRGQTPVLRVPLSRDHLAAISGITEEGQLLMKMQEQAFHGVGVVGFLKHLRRHIKGKLLVIWDGVPIHRDKAVAAYLTTDEGKELWVEQLPGYAPDLNPDEGVWDYLKYVELRNLCCHDLDELRQEVRCAFARLRHKPDLIRSFFKHYGY